jgi:hypothetical protein
MEKESSKIDAASTYLQTRKMARKIKNGFFDKKFNIIFTHIYWFTILLVVIAACIPHNAPISLQMANTYAEQTNGAILTQRGLPEASDTPPASLPSQNRRRKRDIIQ